MANKHFFKPLLPGFHSHLTIPVAFFLKYINGRNGQKTAKLRSDASKVIWNVKLDGQRLTEGWKEFALAHDLRIGDIVIFRQERDLAFNVTPLGPSCCEIQYGSCLDEETNLEKKKEKKSPNEEAESSSLDPPCFVANVTPSSLRYDSLLLPRAFVRSNRVVPGSGEIVLMNEKGRSWNLKIKQKPSCGSVYIRGGWRTFCHANRLKIGDTVSFKLIQRGGTRVLHLLPKEPKEEDNDVSLSTEPESDEDSNIEKYQRQRKMKKSPRRDTKSSSLDPSCFVANIPPSTLRYDSMYLPKRFMRENGIATRGGEIILMNQKGRSWCLVLRRKKSCGTFYITRGWRSFCRANGLRAESKVTFKLIKEGGTLTLRLTPNEGEEEEEEESSEADEVASLSTDQESDGESSHDVKISQECSRRNEKKRRLRWTASSSSPSNNRFVTLTITPYNFIGSVLRLPIPFTRMNDINEETKMTLLDKHGGKWPTKLHLEDDKSKRLRMVGGWKGFLQANYVKANESIMLELIWEEDTSCVLKFRSKVNL